MDKNSYLKSLDENLSSLSKEEREEAIKYYEEYFNDASDDEKVINELGDPKHLADNILKDYNVKAETKKAVTLESNNRTTILLIVIILCIAFSPVILPGILGIIAAIFGISIAGIAMIGVSIAFVGLAIGMYTTSFAMGTLFLGIAFIILSIGVIFAYFGIKLIPLFIKGIVALGRKIFNGGGNK